MEIEREFPGAVELLSVRMIVACEDRRGLICMRCARPAKLITWDSDARTDGIGRQWICQAASKDAVPSCGWEGNRNG